MVFLVLLGVLTGCQKNREEKIEITVIHGWGSNETEHIAMRQIYKEFEEKHPEIHLNLISLPSSTEVISKVGDLLAVGTIPDVIFTGGEGRESIYNFMLRKGYAVDLLPYIESDEDFAADVSPVILDYWTTKEGKLYTLSDVLLMGGYWYNEDIFERAGITEVPGTWEEWYSACEKIEKLNDSVTPVILDADHMTYLMTVLLANENVAEVKNVKDCEINVNTPAFGNMLEQLKLISEYAVLGENYSYRDTLSAFNEGKSAIYINGVWANSMIDSKLRVSYAAFPSEDGKGIVTQSACVGYILGNTEDEQRINASVEFLKYMLSDETAEKIMEQTGQVPSNPNVKITEKNAGKRMTQAVDCVKNAGLVIETPENLWNLGEKEEYRKNVILYLKNEITEQEFQKRLSRM